MNNGVSRKTFHVISEDGVRRLRVPFSPAVHCKFNPDKMFHPIWESSNFLDMFLPESGTYGEVSTFSSGPEALLDAVQQFEQIGKRGFYSTNLPIGQAHRVIYGDWDDHGASVLVPVGCGVSKLEDLGVQLVMNAESDKRKVRKYFRRIRAHHEWAVGGTVSPGYVTKLGEILCGNIGGRTFDILHVDIEQFNERNQALIDGIHLVDVDLLHHLGEITDNAKLKSMQVGDAFKGTLFSCLGLGKGFFHVVNLPRFGIIVYGPKKQMRFSKLFFGSLGEVKGGAAYTCVQSLGAFITAGSRRLWVNQAMLFLHEVMEAMHDEEKLRHLFLVNVASLAEMVENNDTEAWVLVEALRHGVPILRNPGLFRRVVRHLMTRVLDCERGRIPYGPVAHRYNLMPDLTCFDLETGEVDYRKSVIPEDAVCCMDSDQGPFAIYRQPLGNGKEAVVTTNIHNRRFRKFIGRERVILGISALEQLKIMGGADFDDSIIGTSNLDWVELISKAEYPITPLPASEARVVLDLDQDNPYLNGGEITVNGQKVHFQGVRRRQYPCNWSMADYFDAAAKATEQQMSIGPIDNAGRLDLLLSGEHKQNMLRNLAARIKNATDVADKATLQRAFNWLSNREDHQLREVMSNLEAFIDAIKMGKGDISALGELSAKIKTVSQDSLIYPECWTWLGRNKAGRVPAKRQEARDYVLAPSLVCETLNRIRIERDKLMEALREEEWTMVERIPATLDEQFPHNPGVRDEAFSLRSLWREWWEPFLTNQTPIALDKAYKITLNGGEVPLHSGGKIEVDGVRKLFNQWKNKEGGDPSDDLRLSLAVEIARQTYRTRYSEAQRNEDGRRRGFSDGLLWTNAVGLWYIEAMVEAGLAGLYMPVKFDRYSANMSRSTMAVRVTAGIVSKRSDNFLIGYVVGEDEIGDGDYTMRDGMICVKESADELRKAIDDLDDVFDNPVTDEELEVLA